jgi:uncharacterized DUF497 family protein
MPYRFEWNSRKATLNIRKHGVSFDEASTVFDDPLAVIFAGRLLLVSFAEQPGNLLRLISARVATRNERQDYEENLKP